MAKFIPFSLVVMTIVLSAIMAGRPRVKQSVRTLHILMAIFIAIWGYLCLNVYTQYVLLE